MRRFAPLRGLLTGLIALVVVVSAAVALATGSSAPTPPGQLPVGAAPAEAGTTATQNGTTNGALDDGTDAQALAVVGDGGRDGDGDGDDGRGFGGRGGGGGGRGFGGGGLR